MRSLVETLPFLALPSWVDTPTQPVQSDAAARAFDVAPCSVRDALRAALAPAERGPSGDTATLSLA